MKRRFWLPLLALALAVSHPLSAEPLFPNSSYSVGSVSTAVATGDFNRDGNPDVAVADAEFESGNPFPTGYVLVRFGQGDGTFGDEIRFPCGISPRSLAAGDVNGDSNVDLVVTDDRDHQVRTLLGSGDGGFGPPIAQTLGQSPSSVRLLDLDSNGVLDIVVIDQTQLVIQYNFIFGFYLSLYLGYNAGDVTSGDFNGDSLPDLATPIRIYLNTGQGGFQPGGFLPGAGYPIGVSTGDFDEDGLLDLAVIQYSGEPGYLNVLRGLGDGTFSSEASLPAGLSARHPTVGDFDGDGHLDVVVLNVEDSGRLAYFHGRGDGTFDGALQLGYGLSRPTDFAAADLNGDLRVDLAVLNGALSVAVLLGGGPGGFLSGVRLGDDTPSRSAAIADFDGDGRLDVAIGLDLNLGVRSFRGGGDGTFVPTQNIAVGASSSLGVGDLNGDGKPDLAVTQGGPNSDCLGIAILLGNGDGTFTALGEVTAGCQPVSVGLGDFNRDHKIDLAVANDASSYGSILLGRGDGTFDPPITLAMPDAGHYVAVGDFDRDGDDDVVFTHRNYQNAVSVFLSRGDGTFDSETRFSVGDVSEGVIARDLNGDGKLDLATANYSSFDVSILLGRGDGTFDSDQSFAAGSYPRFLTAGDFDADGNVDLAVTQSNGGIVTILLGQGDGTFDVSEQLTARQVQGIASGDFNADGRSDLALGALPALVLMSQPPPDTDGDGIPDDADPCTDVDGDGFGDPGFESNTCALDSCPTVSNPGQEDSDGDYLGDACDPCPLDLYNDPDQDGVCGNVDNCQWVYNPGQEPTPDQDGDGILDACDNCPSVANPDQADLKHPDGWGDACQPFISILDIREDGGTELEVTAQAGDPQGETLSGHFFFYASDNFTLHNTPSGTPSCDMDLFPAHRAGVGLGYTVENGHFILFDVDSRLTCQDGVQDFEIAVGLEQGHCSDAQTVFSPSLDLSDLTHVPALLCVRRVGHPESEMEWVTIDFDQASFQAAYITYHSIPFEGGLPSRTDISALTYGLVYDLNFFVTDGNTGEAYDVRSFLYQGETTMVLQSPSGSPEARVSAQTEVECDGPGRGTVVLDGSASTPGSAGGTLISYEWFVDFGEASQQLLGTGAILPTTLPLGSSAVTLRVTDDQEQTATVGITITVRDTTPPLFVLALDRSTLWPPNHSMVDVHAAWTVLDVCDPSTAVSLVSIISSEPEDAPGNNDGNTSVDILGADTGLPDEVFALRAERSAAGPGRTYEITYRAVDASGNTAPALVIVTVPHDLGSGPDPLHLRVENPGSPGAAEVYWNAVGGAPAYDLISGDLGSVRMSAGRTSLGSVIALARNTTELSWSAGSSGRVPAAGHAFFYLVQYRNEQGGTGYGTESAPWPREPDSYEGESSGQPGSAAGVPTRKLASEGGSP